MQMKNINGALKAFTRAIKVNPNIYFRRCGSSYRTQTKKFIHKNIILASVATIGFSIYLSRKNNIICDATPPPEDEINEDLLEKRAIEKSRELLKQIKDELGIPGIVVAVSIDGKTVWEEGIGYADLENRVLCTPDTVMRVGSISKSFTMAIVAKLWEQGQIDIDKPIQKYVPSFPQKSFNGKQVTITCKHLLSHLSGIRHYEKVIVNAENGQKRDEFSSGEYYIKEKHDVQSSLKLFQDDPLLVEPGSKFLYTTHGWTVVSAIVEAVTKEQFPSTVKKLFKDLGMRHTYLDENDNLIYHRSRNYVKTNKGKIINTPYVDNSYKWAGGGMLSTVQDLLRFGNAMLYSLQAETDNITNSPSTYSHKSSTDLKSTDNNKESTNLETENTCYSVKLPGYLNSKTVEAMWTSVAPKYGLGWFVLPENQQCQFCEKTKFTVFHTGGAIGASSILLILPKQHFKNQPPKGIIVTILANLQTINFADAAIKIAEFFDTE